MINPYEINKLRVWGSNSRPLDYKYTGYKCDAPTVSVSCLVIFSLGWAQLVGLYKVHVLISNLNAVWYGESKLKSFQQEICQQEILEYWERKWFQRTDKRFCANRRTMNWIADFSEPTNNRNKFLYSVYERSCSGFVLRCAYFKVKFERYTNPKTNIAERDLDI